MDHHRTILLIVYEINTFVEVCTLGRDAFDKLVEKMRSMHALLAGDIGLSVNELALMFAFALEEKTFVLVGHVFTRWKDDKTNHNINRKGLSMHGPHVAGGMFVVSGSSLWRDEPQGLLGIGSDADSGADLPESWRSLVNLEVDVRVFEQGDGSAEATDAPADDRDTERLG